MRVIVHQEPNAEDNAALQAWYSRSSKGVEEHLQKLSREGSGKFMDQIFIQYGHASVGDLGFTTVHFEGISMLGAKAIQDNPLYNGQECSSRYIDFGSAQFLTGVYSVDGRKEKVQAMLEKMRQFYVRSLPVVVNHVSAQYPIQDGEDQSVYIKAVRARAFDILRAFLPCGATTNVAWTGTLRNLKERLELLMHHPLQEVRTFSAYAYKSLYAKYPHSFTEGYASTFNSGMSNLRAIEGDELYDFMSDPFHFYSDILVTDTEYEEGFDLVKPSSPYCLGLPNTHLDLMHYVTRHPKGRRPTRHGGSEQYRVSITGTLDFGSFRDIQRHRAGYCSMPAVDPYDGFHLWYYENLPASVQAEADVLLKEIKALDYELISANPTTQQRLDNQYFLPMGCLVPLSLEYTLSHAIYVAELRSGQTVHPTLRPLAQSLAQYLDECGSDIHYDHRPDIWSVRRGKQDIVEKKVA